MYYYDDYPCNNPFYEGPNGYWLYGEFIEEDDEEDFDPDDYPDYNDDAPPVVRQKPWSPEDLDDLPF